MTIDRASIAAVWVATAIAVIAEIVTASRAFLPTALALTSAIAVVVSMGAQLAVGRQQGFVARLAASSAGAFGVVLVGAVVALAV